MARTRPTNVQVLERRRKAIELRLAGADYAQIAEQVGYAGKSGAYQAVREGMAEAIREPAQQIIDQELARLDAMLLGLWGKARRGDVAAIDRVIRLMDRRAKYLGLDTPEKHEIEVRDGDLADLDEAARAWALQQKP